MIMGIFVSGKAVRWSHHQPPTKLRLRMHSAIFPLRQMSS